MSYFVEPLVINTDAISPPKPSGGLWGNRMCAYFLYDAPGVPKCSIYVLGDKNLDKTRYCVECVLQYTQDVNYELILVDNGPDDAAYDYFQSVPKENKQIIRVTKSVGSAFLFKSVCDIFNGKYLVTLAGDVYVTQNWLSNLLKCIESDVRIGLVVPVSNNTESFQQVEFVFSDFESMQKTAEEYNISDSSKWEERLRLLPSAAIYSRPAIDITGLPDAAYIHSFAEDDFSLRLRRNGFKLMLCRDTWVYRDSGGSGDKFADVPEKAIVGDFAIFRQKHHGLDPRADIDNYERELIGALDTFPLPGKGVSVLTVDGRCGAPALEIRNILRRRGITDVTSYAFTGDAKYFLDLQTVCHDVKRDRIEFIQEHYTGGSFDVVALCEPLNAYFRPTTVLQTLYELVKPGSVLLFKLFNMDDYRAFLRVTGLVDMPNTYAYVNITAKKVLECLENLGAEDCAISANVEDMTHDDRLLLFEKLRAVNPQANQETLEYLCVKEYCYAVIKG